MNDAQKILIVDDEENIRRIFKKALEKKNYTVHTSKNAEDALQKITNQNYLLIFSDIFMDEMSGLTLLKEVKKINPQAKIVVMTAQDTMNNTIEAMRTGAYEYISKPFDFEAVYALVDRVEASREVQVPSRSEIGDEIDGHSVRSIVGKNKMMQNIFKTIGKSASSDLSVLITGESGTGKEMIAETMHYYSKRKDHLLYVSTVLLFQENFLNPNYSAMKRVPLPGQSIKKKGSSK